ncbi:MAG: DUF2326 domain-containing protein [Chloroflexota bacterium]|nr:DUF2326 domain-containing protein [Chloroflexota bacterium]MDE2951361.1 DUF2326 domain-containing protein [Chloroflexota bacterium]
MILGVHANREEFNKVQFSEGFNVVVADITQQSTQKDSRNGLGKTTLLNIIHFCLGGREQPNVGLRVPKLKGWEFSVDLYFRDEEITVSRSVDMTGDVLTDAKEEWFIENIADRYDLTPQQQGLEFTDVRIKSRRRIDDWTSVLGWVMYDLPVESAATFRNLISYDIRRNQFENPFENFPRQSTKDIQISNAFMLDLNWNHAVKWQELKDRKKSVDSIKRAVKQGDNLLAEMLGTIGDLETERDRLTREIEKTDSELRTFQVHPQYVQIENEANELTRHIHDLSNHVLQLKRLIDFHEDSMKEEQPAKDSRVIELYEEAGVVMAESLTKRLEEVQAFHVQVTRNRRDYLRSEVMRLNRELANSRSEIERLSNRKAELMRVLESHGALEEYSELQKLYLAYRSTLDAIERQIEQLNMIETETSQITIEREQLHLDARIDLEERTSLRQAREVFSSNSEALYEAPGRLVVNVDREAGFRFDVDIPRASSVGISKMKVFCYDLMRAELWSQREVGPSLLIHDSNIFDGVDERQIALAIELAELKTRECGFQYIVCMNSDSIPYQRFSEGFDIDKFVRLRLTDSEPAGRLLGIEF